MPKKVLAILGSPHKDGVIAKMLEHAVHMAEKKGYDVTMIDLYEKNMEYCNGCMVCRKTGKCVKKDDMQEISELLMGSDIVILAAPVYWANVPAPVKNLFDRLAGIVMEETIAFPKPHCKGKKYMLLTSCHTPAPLSWFAGQSRGIIRNMDEFFKTAGMKSMGKIVCAGTMQRWTVPDKVIRKIERCWR